MKFYGAAVILVIALLGALYFYNESSQQAPAPSPAGRPDAGDIRNLKIN